MMASRMGKAAPAPLAPIEAKTVAEAIAALGRMGFTTWFRAVDEGLQVLEAGSLVVGKTFAPEDLVIRAFYRFEGVSDPDDMAVVYAIETRDGAVRGTLTDAFGVYADPDTGAVVDRIRRAADGEPKRARPVEARTDRAR
jgi:hypothetical protein